MLARGEITDVYLELERYWNDGSPSGFNETVSSRYAPTSTGTFRMPVFEANIDACIQVGRPPSSLGGGQSGATLPVPMHPDAIDATIQTAHAMRRRPIAWKEVVPTASGRTVLMVDEPTQFIKLHYPAFLGRYPRDLRLFKWLAALENSRELRSHEQAFPPTMGYLPEDAGTFVAGSMETGFGVIYRSAAARPVQEQARVLIPAFSLFARRQTGSLICQILRARRDPFESLMGEFVEPLLSAYALLADRLGMIPECNAQNVLFEATPELCVSRVVFRDLGDMFKDLSRRAELGLHTAFCDYKSIDRARDRDYFERRSFSFDFKLGEYILGPLIAMVAEGMGVDVRRLQCAVREVALSTMPDPEEYFGSRTTWFSYPDEVQPGRGRYVQHERPRFR